MHPQDIWLDLDGPLADWHTGTHDDIGEPIPGAQQFVRDAMALAEEAGSGVGYYLSLIHI